MINQKKTFTEIQACNIMYQLLSAVSYIHKKGFVHRDLKPENIMFTHTGDQALLKIIDFGSSCSLEPNKKLEKIHGSALYIAPEVLRKKYDEKCDIWSCGVILYILLCG